MKNVTDNEDVNATRLAWMALKVACSGFGLLTMMIARTLVCLACLKYLFA